MEKGEPQGVPLDQLPPNALMTLKKQFEEVQAILI